MQAACTKSYDSRFNQTVLIYLVSTFIVLVKEESLAVTLVCSES